MISLISERKEIKAGFSFPVDNFVFCWLSKVKELSAADILLLLIYLAIADVIKE